MIDVPQDGRRDSFARRVSNAAVAMGTEALETLAASQSAAASSPPSSRVSPDTPPQKDSTHRVSDALEASPHSIMDNIISTNVLALIASIFTIALIEVIFEPLRHLSTKTSLDLTSASAFVGMLIVLAAFFVVRYEDELYRKGCKVTLPTAVTVSCLMLYAFGGNTGIYTIPLITLMLNIQISMKWVVEPTPRPNPLVYFLRNIITSVVVSTIGLLPPFAMAIPGRLLSKHPRAYAVWCGVVSSCNILRSLSPIYLY
jgi:hypothetical protein